MLRWRLCLFMCLDGWKHCRRCNWYHNLLRHHHFHRILLLLCLLPVLPLSYTWDCDRDWRPTAVSANRNYKHQHDTARICAISTAWKLQPATAYLFTTRSSTVSFSSGTRTSCYDAASRSGEVLTQGNMERAKGWCLSFHIVVCYARNRLGCYGKFFNLVGYLDLEKLSRIKELISAFSLAIIVFKFDFGKQIL